MIFLVPVLLANSWIYKITLANFFVGALVITTTILLYKGSRFAFLFFLPLLIFQITITQKSSLTNIANDDRRLIDLRLRAYPVSVLRVGHWLEERKESIALGRVSKNFFENLDSNLYFFANHPRERIGIKEFEKFHFIFLPFFLAGLFDLIKTGQWALPVLSFLIPLSVLSFIGNQNILGPFSVFPFFAICITTGVKKYFG